MTLSLKSVLLFAGLATALTACTPNTDERTAGVPADSIASIVTLAAQQFLDTTPQAVGFSISVVAADDIHSFHFGTTSPQGTDTPTDNTIYGIASVTKTFTGVLLAKAVLDGRLDLSSDIRGYLDGDYPNLAYNGHFITPAHLVNHSSELPNGLPDRPEMHPEFAGYDGDVLAWMDHMKSVYADYATEDFLVDLQSVQLDTIPGTRFSYSNAGPQLAGFMLERVYGETYEALLDRVIFEPLGMARTGITLDADVITGYDETGQAMPPVLAAYGAAGAIKSTIVDLGRYVQWHLNEDDPLVKLSHTPPGGSAEDPAEGFSLGLNWQMMRYEGVRRLWQDGNIPGYSSRVVMYPELNLGVVILANQLDRSIPGKTNDMADTILEGLDARAFTIMEGL
ncbi:MAG: serine hydrolase domain-containing protein [Bacteroidota bacterium]